MTIKGEIGTGNIKKSATYVSVWDGQAIESRAKVDLDTMECEILDVHEDDGSYDVLEDEYVVVDGLKYDVQDKDIRDAEDDPHTFWYE